MLAPLWLWAFMKFYGNAMAKQSSFPPGFEQVLSNRFGPVQAEEILGHFNCSPKVSVRLHPEKGMQAQWNGMEKLPFCKGGYALQTRPVFTMDPLWHAGAYYVQDGASQLLDFIFSKLPDVALAIDLCASPGGKSLLLSEHAEVIWCNESDPKRFRILQETMWKWGIVHAVYSQFDARNMGGFNLDGQFGLVLADVPCSGEGMFRKDPYAVKQWNPTLLKQCCYVQAGILRKAIDITAAGGYLVYTTCTLNPDENEHQITAQIDLDLWEQVLFPEVLQWGLKPGIGGIGYYSFPGIGPGEGLFISVWKKKGDLPFFKLNTLRQNIAYEGFELNIPANTYLRVSEESVVLASERMADLMAQFQISFRSFGLPLISKDLPEQPAAWLPEMNYENHLNVEESEAIQYLKGQALQSAGIPKGLTLIKCKGLGLGWGKEIGIRINNLYPKPLRIRMNG